MVRGCRQDEGWVDGILALERGRGVDTVITWPCGDASLWKYFLFQCIAVGGNRTPTKHS